MPDQNFFDFVVNLVKLGGLGLGALIFVLIFIILFRNQPTDERTAKLRSQFLIFGCGFAIVALITSTMTSYLQRPPTGRSTYNVGVTLSPSFEDAQLPDPTMMLMPAGIPIQPDKPFELASDGTIAIKVRGIVQSVAALKSASTEMLKTNQVLTAALDTKPPATASAVPQGGDGPAPQPTGIPSPIDPAALKAIRQTQASIGANLARGDFNAAALGSARMGVIAKSAVVDR